MFPEYTGTLLSAIANQSKLPKTAAEAYSQAKAFAESHGLTLLNDTPFTDSDALAAQAGLRHAAPPQDGGRPEVGSASP